VQENPPLEKVSQGKSQEQEKRHTQILSKPSKEILVHSTYEKYKERHSLYI